MDGVSRAKVVGSKAAELLTSAADVIAHALVRLACLGDERAGELAAMIVSHIAQRWGGRAFYVALHAKDRTAQRCRAEAEGCSGKNPTELFADVSAFCRQTLIAEGVANEAKAASFALDVRHLIEDAWAGQSIYVPRNWRGMHVERDEAIFKRFHAGNAQDLAAEYGLSYVRIYQIVARMRKELQQRAAIEAGRDVAPATQHGRWQTTNVSIN